MRLRVMTYNILDGGVGREDLLLQVIKAQKPDVVVLQEILDEVLLERYATALGMHRFFAKANIIIARNGWKLRFVRRNIGLLSRFPITYQNNYRRFPLWRTLLEVKIEVAPNQYIGVFGIHLKADLFVLSEIWRVAELRQITRRIKAYNLPRYVVCGDFNAIAPDDKANIATFPRRLKTKVWLQGGRVLHFAIARMLATGVVDCYRKQHPHTAGFTLPPPTPNTRLDYIFANPALANCLQYCDVMTTAPSAKASDHYPVVADFEL